MLRAATSNIVKRTIISSSQGVLGCAAPRVHFHASARREKDTTPYEIEETKVSKAWFALPIGILAAVPILHYEYYVVNEETQLAGCVVAFVVSVYYGLGDMLNKMMTEPGLQILKEQNEMEQKLIDSREQELAFYRAQGNKANDFEAINKIRAKAYADLNAAGMVKPQHDLKAQMEKVVALIAVEESRVTEGAKSQLMHAATASVVGQFKERKDLKKAALEAAIAKINGTAKPGDDPVSRAFVTFFKDAGIAASKVDDKAESLALRASIVAKMNTVCKNENYMFQFDESGKPKMVV